MNKVKANGILARMARIQRELYALSAEFGDVDNYFLTELEDTSNRVGRLIAEVKEWKNDWEGVSVTHPVPTQLDIDNAARRSDIAARFKREYEDALSIATTLLGPGWAPTGRHFLTDKQDEDACRRAGTKPTPVATVITVRNSAGQARHFRADGTPRECASVKAGFAHMLTEPHPTLRLPWAGREIIPHRYSLNWGWYEPGYRPKSADQLATARVRRQEKAVEREAENAPLFADQIREEGYVAKPRGPSL